MGDTANTDQRAALHDSESECTVVAVARKHALQLFEPRTVQFVQMSARAAIYHRMFSSQSTF